MKIKKPFSYLLLLLAAVLVVLLSACETFESTAAGSLVSAVFENNTDASSELRVCFAELGDEVEYSKGDYPKGKLIYTASNARVVTNIVDIQSEDAVNEGFAYFAFYLGDEDADYDPAYQVTYSYPYIADENGDFVNGGYLILVDFTVRSDNAMCYTVYDLDSEGYPRGLYRDPYLFIPMAFLTDMSYVEDDPYNPFSIDFGYYSRLYEETESPRGFHLEPGESIDFTLGWFVTDKEFGGAFDISSLALEFGAEIDGECIATYIELPIDPREVT